MNMELMCPDGREKNAVGTILKLAETVEVGSEKRRSNAMKGVCRARTAEVESDGPHFSNEHNEVCNETFSSFNFIFAAVGSAGNSAGTRSILSSTSKN